MRSVQGKLSIIIDRIWRKTLMDAQKISENIPESLSVLVYTCFLIVSSSFIFLFSSQIISMKNLYLRICWLLQFIQLIHLFFEITSCIGRLFVQRIPNNRTCQKTDVTKMYLSFEKLQLQKNKIMWKKYAFQTKRIWYPWMKLYYVKLMATFHGSSKVPV